MKISELRELGRWIGMATAGSFVDFVELAAILNRARGIDARFRVPGDVLEALREWYRREVSKSPEVLQRFRSAILPEKEQT